GTTGVRGRLTDLRAVFVDIPGAAAPRDEADLEGVAVSESGAFPAMAVVAPSVRPKVGPEEDRLRRCSAPLSAGHPRFHPVLIRLRRPEVGPGGSDPHFVVDELVGRMDRLQDAGLDVGSGSVERR